MRRLAVTTWGTVQGVGFRPFVYAAATTRGLSGWVKNASDAVRLEVQGPDEALDAFLTALASPPGAARIERIEAREVPLDPRAGFAILDSESDGAVLPTLPADLAICRRCALEMDDPGERRHRYPFTNCAHCGPRYSLALTLPYDRANTSMQRFALCQACAAEYAEPRDRRFHAQPIACPRCGPRLRLLTAAGALVAEREDALDAVVVALGRGELVALQGLGGFQLLVDAFDAAAVARLRARKRREDKPFAVMFPSLSSARLHCALSPPEEEALASSLAPIVLVKKRADALALAENVAPNNPRLGALLPYTPLHRLLLTALERPLVCTSGNFSGEPLCVDEATALDRLGAIADLFLVHDRPIVRPLDDSVARVDSDGLQVLRRARGLTPLPLRLSHARPGNVLAVGAQLKSTLALGKQGQVVVSQHLGDLFSAASVRLLEHTARDLVRLFDARPDVVACDLHDDYASTRLAEKLATEWGVPLERVQHHHAHVAACVAEHGISEPVLGLVWDGAGLGSDGTVWGGEALVVSGPSFSRVAHLRPFSLPGGEAAMREPARSALGLLHEVFGAGAARHLDVEATRANAWAALLVGRVNAPRTTSMGRLFDAVAALLGLRARVSYEGQAAMDVEFAAGDLDGARAYPFPLLEGEPALADWEPMLHALLEDRRNSVPMAVVAARFHESLVDLAERIAVRAGVPRVVLTGGCFQNLRLSEAVRRRLRARGFRVFTPRLYPPNDGGLSLGQLYVAACRLVSESLCAAPQRRGCLSWEQADVSRDPG